MCADDGLQKVVSSCMLANCTMNDMLSMYTLDRRQSIADTHLLVLAKVERDQCDLSRDDRSRALLLCTVIAYTIAVVFTGLRVLSRPSMRQLRMDDWIIIAGLCVAAIAIGCVVKSMLGFKGYSHCADLSDSVNNRIWQAPLGSRTGTTQAMLDIL